MSINAALDNVPGTFADARLTVSLPDAPSNQQVLMIIQAIVA